MPTNDDAPRPAEDFVVIHSTPEMTMEAAMLLTNAAYCWFDRPPSRDEKGAMLRALASTTSALESDILLTEHYPEPFLVRFTHPHHREAAVAKHDFPFGTLRVQVRPWRLEDHAEQVNLKHHVRLCVENVPLYAWNDIAAQQVIGRACSLDYIETACKTKQYTKALCLWAWVEKPSLVPRVRHVTLPGPNAPSGVRERGRRGLQRRCTIHLDIAEDLSGPVDEPPPPPSSFTWRFGQVDGERVQRARPANAANADTDRRDHRRDRDDDEDRSRRGRDNSRGWGAAIRRSLSRGSRPRGQDDDRRRDQGRERDRSGNRDGGRRHAGVALAPVFVPRAAGAAVLAARPRGRPWAHSASPALIRRRSAAATTPPQSPDRASSPTSVCPAPSRSKDDRRSKFVLLSRDGTAPTRVSLSARSIHSTSEEARRVLEILAPPSLVLTPSRPPGFDSSPILQPASPSASSDAAPPSPTSSVGSEASDAAGLLDPLFSASQQTLLSSPWSSAPRRPANRRKTLAGQDIVRHSGFSLRRASKRVKEQRKAKPVARAAEAAVCRGLGIVQDGEEITERAMAEFARLYVGIVPDAVLAAMRVLFKVQTPEDDALDDALLNHGGAAGLDHDAVDEAAADA